MFFPHRRRPSAPESWESPVWRLWESTLCWKCMQDSIVLYVYAPFILERESKVSIRFQSSLFYTSTAPWHVQEKMDFFRNSDKTENQAGWSLPEKSVLQKKWAPPRHEGPWVERKLPAGRSGVRRERKTQAGWLVRSSENRRLIPQVSFTGIQFWNGSFHIFFPQIIQKEGASLVTVGVLTVPKRWPQGPCQGRLLSPRGDHGGCKQGLF